MPRRLVASDQPGAVGRKLFRARILLPEYLSDDAFRLYAHYGVNEHDDLRRRVVLRRERRFCRN